MSFAKFPPDEIGLWYVEGLRRNPKFRHECDEAIKKFIEADDIWKEELKDPEKSQHNIEMLLRSPEVIRDFMDYSIEAEALAKRWGLKEAWHYDCPDFPSFILCSVAHAKTFRRLITPEKVVKSLFNENGWLQIDINPMAPKKDILAYVAQCIDEVTPQKKKRGISTSDTETVFEIYDMNQAGKKPWQIAQELYPRVRGQNPAIDLEAKRNLKNVTDALKRAKRIIDSIKAIE
jgi:hypothetical protein